MATPKRTPPKRSASASSRKATPTKTTAARKATAKKAPAKRAAPSFDSQMNSAKSRSTPAYAKTPIADPASFAAIVKALKAAYGGKTFTVLDVPWEERDIARALGAEWVEKIHSYVYSGDNITDRLENYASKDYSYSRWLEDQINGRIKPSKKPVDGYYTLKEHQLQAVEAIRTTASAGWRGFLQADLMGIGKTLSGLVGANEVAKLKGFTPAKKAKLLILCPNGAVAHWRNSIQHAQVDSLRVMVVNYESHKKLLTVPKAAQAAKKKKTQNKHIATKGNPMFKWDIIIADESHMLKNITSQQTQAFERIAQYALESKVAPYVIWMSATAGQTPLEVGYLSPLIGQAARTKITMETWPEWLSQNGFHVTKKGQSWHWIKPTSPNDAITRERQRQDVARLAGIIFHPKAPAIRRKPEDIAGWPALNRIAMPVQLGNAQRDKYEKLWMDFRKDMKLTGSGKNPVSVLTMQLRFAQKASLLRVSQTVENIMEQLENGFQVAVSGRFHETLDAIRAGLKAKGIECSEHSGRGHIDKDQERINFQKGKTRVMLFTTMESVSFHANESLPDGSKATSAPRALLVHDMRYSAIAMTQIAGRTHRDGQKSNAYFLYSENTVEEKIMYIMMNKMENMGTLSGDSEEDAIVEILQSVLA